MTPPTPYDTSPDESQPLTRVDMLLALYAEALKRAQLALDAVEREDDAEAAIHRTRGAAVVAAIRSGIDLSQGGTTEKVDQLCTHVQFCFTEGDATRLQSAAHVLTQLHEGFSGVRNDAVRMEREGAIPPLSDASTVDANV